MKDSVLKNTRPQFVIITLPRSGSYHLVNLLNSAKDVQCHGEILKKNKIELSRWHESKLQIDTTNIAVRDSDPYGFIMRLRMLNSQEIFGFKAFYQHFSVELVNKILLSIDWKKIFLFRNPLEIYASLMRAKASNIWTLRSKKNQHDENILNMKIIFDSKRFDYQIACHRNLMKKFHDIRKIEPRNTIKIDYKEISDLNKLNWLLQFIGSQSKADTLKSDLQKQFTIPFKEGFHNWEEVESYLHLKNLSELIP